MENSNPDINNIKKILNELNDTDQESFLDIMLSKTINSYLQCPDISITDIISGKCSNTAIQHIRECEDCQELLIASFKANMEFIPEFIQHKEKIENAIGCEIMIDEQIDEQLEADSQSQAYPNQIQKPVDQNNVPNRKSYSTRIKDAIRVLFAKPKYAAVFGFILGIIIPGIILLSYYTGNKNKQVNHMSDEQNQDITIHDIDSLMADFPFQDDMIHNIADTNPSYLEEKIRSELSRIRITSHYQSDIEEYFNSLNNDTNALINELFILKLDLKNDMLIYSNVVFYISTFIVNNFQTDYNDNPLSGLINDINLQSRNVCAWAINELSKVEVSWLSDQARLQYIDKLTGIKTMITNQPFQSIHKESIDRLEIMILKLKETND